MSEPATAGLLATAPLFEGLQHSDLVEVARVMRHRPTRAGDVLWHQGAEAKGMALIVEGRVSVELRLPGDRAFEFADIGPGETLGELPLIDGGPHSATARVSEAGSMLFLSRADFSALVSRHDPVAFALRRRFVEASTARLRRQLAYLGESLGPPPPVGAAADPARPPVQLEFTGPPDSRYIRRMASFRAFDPLALWGFLTRGRYAHCPRGQTLEEEGAPATGLYVVINGAVERVLMRGPRRIRVGLAGPGQAFGYEGLIDGQPSPATAIARERALLLMLPHDAFARLFEGECSESLTFLDVINRDLAGWLRRAIRPQAHLAVRPIT
jgi:CRP-like cAMP-binding protein